MLDKLRNVLTDANIDCVALVPGANLRYMTGLSFHLSERPTIVLMPREGTPAFLVPTLEEVRFADFDRYEVNLFTYADGEDPAHALYEAIASLPEIQRVAVEHLTMRVLELRLLQQRLPLAYIEEAEPLMDEMRLYKSVDEVGAMQQAVHISEQALEHVLANIQVGMTEQEIAAMLSLAQINLGGSEPPFPPIVLSGPRAALPHGTPGERRLQAGDVLLIDFGTRKAGYVSDITRCFFVGEPNDKAREVYEVVQQANAAAREVAEPGVLCKDVDAAARQVIEAAGYGDYFTHRVGHGIGLEGHERPSLHGQNEQPLEVGMAFTIEPGIYIPGEVGVRIEDDVVVTEDGIDSLTTFSREMHIIGD